MAHRLVEELLADAEETERLRDRYQYKGNAKYPRAFPGEAFATLDAKAHRLRQAAAIVALAMDHPHPCSCDLVLAKLGADGGRNGASAKARPEWPAVGEFIDIPEADK